MKMSQLLWKWGLYKNVEYDTSEWLTALKLSASVRIPHRKKQHKMAQRTNGLFMAPMTPSSKKIPFLNFLKEEYYTYSPVIHTCNATASMSSVFLNVIYFKVHLYVHI